MIILDLEYYQPVEDRPIVKFGINPYKEDNFIIGGHFIIRKAPWRKSDQESKGMWIWDYKDEKELLQDIYGLIISHKPQKFNQLMLVGIGISNSDIPTLLARLDYLNIIPKEQSFLEIKKYSHLDLGQVGSSMIINPFLRPVGHKAIVEKILGESNKLDDSKSVWDYYEDKEFDKIAERTKSEVEEIAKIYDKLTKPMRYKYMRQSNFNKRNI